MHTRVRVKSGAVPALGYIFHIKNDNAIFSFLLIFINTFNLFLSIFNVIGEWYNGKIYIQKNIKLYIFLSLS